MGEIQLLYNIAVGLAGFLGAWVLKTITDTLKDMRQSDDVLRDKVQSIEVVLAGKYVLKDDLDRMESALSIKLDRIVDKLDSKQDKAHL